MKRSFKPRGKTETVVKIRRAPGTPTKSQLAASALANARTIRARWQTVINQAMAQWPQLAQQDLVRADGNFHVVAGLVQLRCKLSRVEADKQVKAFFDKHELNPIAPPQMVQASAVTAAPAANA